MRRTYVYCEKEGCKKVVEKWSCEHQFPNSSGRSAAPLFTYFEGPNGEVSIPPKEGARMSKRLQQLGYQEKTVQDARGYSQFCKRMDREALEKHQRAYGALQERFKRQQEERREYLREHIKSQYGKDFLEEAIRRSEQGYSDRYSAGSHIEGMEYDSRRGRD